MSVNPWKPSSEFRVGCKTGSEEHSCALRPACVDVISGRCMNIILGTNRPPVQAYLVTRTWATNCVYRHRCCTHTYHMWTVVSRGGVCVYRHRCCTHTYHMWTVVSRGGLCVYRHRCCTHTYHSRGTYCIHCAHQWECESYGFPIPAFPI